MDEQARRARLDSLAAQSDTLREKETALAARHEARRLRDAAGRTKGQAQERQAEPLGEE